MPRMPTFKREALEYLQWCSDRLLSSQTLVTYKDVLRQIGSLIEDRGWPQDPRRWTPGHVRQFYESQQHLSTATQSLRMMILLNFLKFSGNANISEVKPRIKVARTRVDWLDTEKVGLMLRTAPSPRVLAVEALITYTGMRAGEVASLRKKDVHDSYVQVRGKGSKGRNIPVDARFWARIQPYLPVRLESEFFVSRTYRGTVSGYGRHSITDMVREHAQRLNLHCTPHTLRRTFGREMFFNGCPLPQLREIMGHSTVEMTIRYLGIMDSDIQDAIERFLPEYGPKTYLKPPGQEAKQPK